ncbi:hypothetical protein IKG13_01330, partial [Candidatus Saccharibacteria bacterium]|nr:hypothetical protein [Candidatus Saccharibacteria bacterium]
MGKKKNNDPARRKQLISNLFSRVVEAINREDSTPLLFNVITAMAINHTWITEESVFKAAILQIVRTEWPLDELKKNMFGFINTWIDNYYKNNKSSLLIYSQNYQKALVAIVESPQTNEDDKNGIYHLSAARELRGAIKSLKEEYRRDTYNRYATNGC